MSIKEKKRLGFPTRGPSGSEERRRREEGPAFIRVHLQSNVEFLILNFKLWYFLD
jgi:hypothetical protein